MISFSKKKLFIILGIILITILAFGSWFYFNNRYYYNFLVPNHNGELSKLNYGSQSALSDENYFKKIHEEFAKQKVSFIEVNLTDMKLSIYENGAETQSYTIKAKGKEGTWWETPAGLYKIETKERSHYSTFGDVYQPWSMVFQGNFFIHGWPYYPDGTPVASTYSGGCIRLSTEDAEKVFNWAKTGTPVLVFEKDFYSDGFEYKQKIPAISAKNYLVADLKNNFVFLEKDSKNIVPIASLTKLATALTAFEYINLDKELYVFSESLVKTSKPRLKVGDKILAYNLIYPLLLESSNEAAMVLADSLGRTRFVDLMNAKMKAIGLENTFFEDPAGIDVKNTSTAEELFKLSKYIYNNRSFIFKVSSGKMNIPYRPQVFKNLNNFNGFEDDKEFFGGKVGQTEEAGQTIISIFEVQIKGETRPIAVIALGSENNLVDAQAMINWVREFYK